MSGLPWFKCYPRDFNEGMVGLTLEERGAYVTILNLIYSRGGPIPEDAWWITSQLGCTKRNWTKVRAALIVKGKLYAVNFNGVDSLMNGRAADEIQKHFEISQKFSESGARGGRNSASKRSKNNSEPEATLEPASSQPQPRQIQKQITEPTTSNAREADWKTMLAEAAEAAGDMADLTRPAMHHVADLRALVEPSSGEPCTWGEVLDAIRMTAMRQRQKGKQIPSWSWVRSDALALRDKRLNAVNPEAAEVIPFRATGPPNDFAAQQAAVRAEARRRVLEDGQ